MNEPNPIPLRAIHYQVTAAVGLAMICLGMYLQEVESPFPNIFLGVAGAWMILFPRPRIPLIFLMLAFFVQVFVHSEMNAGFPFTLGFKLFEPPTVMLAGGMMIFLCSQYRLIALKWYATPYDPRFPKTRSRDDVGRPIVPLTRPEAAIGPDEIVRIVVNAALCVLFGQLGWHWLSQNWIVAGLPPRFMQIAFLIWLGVIGMFVGAGVVGYWRRAHSDAESAKLYLQEIDWREARREYGRIGRWIAWGKRKAARKKSAESSGS